MIKNENQRLIMDILGTRPIAFNVDLAHALGSVNAGLLLSQLLFWDGKGDDPEWTHKTIKEITGETGLSRSEQDTAIRICKKYNTIKVQRRGIPAKRYFQVNIDSIIKLLKDYYASLSETDKHYCRKPANKIVGDKQSITYKTSDINNIKDVFLLKKKLAEAYKNGDHTRKPFFRGDPMRWVEGKQKWFVINKYKEWLEFSLKEKDIEWR